ncbi:MAG: LacI family transcriptional regulator [Spirochaetae bacterium HGW-Spirochaetae-3]|jgi:DNA-binding LacI/PurR family transcriptional regulator|nr:MAG: LacI family transcriptional regulator [Spirochaetae bacterium HGW-Spirochaetae-3]
MKPKIGIIEVARLAGVSKSTVSRVITESGGSVSPRAQERVTAAIKELGYTRNTLAAGLRAQKTWMVLVMVPDIANPYWSEIARAAQDRLEAEGNSVVVGNTDWLKSREDRYFELARSGRFDGMVINSVTDDIAAINDMGIPVVMVGERAESQDIDTVGTDTTAATRMALEHLWEHGNRRIAIATSDHGGERFLSLRRRAYEDFMADKGVEPDPSLAFSVKLSEEGGRELVGSLLALDGWRDRIDAVFCGNDILAIAAINALRDSGIEAGRDLSLVGMDDIPAAAHTFPALTTVRKPRALIGAAAAELLLARIRDPDRPPERRLFPGELMIRGSVAERHI